MGDNQKIGRRRRCSEYKSLDVIKWRCVTAYIDLSAGIVNICFHPEGKVSRNRTGFRGSGNCG